MVALTLLTFAAPALASSIVYLSSGNVWLASPDGQIQRQVTYGGGWDLPSQADDGTLLALHGGYLLRLDRQGHVLSSVATVFTSAQPGGGLVGPITAAISPDGVHQAYFGENTTGAYYPPCNCILTDSHTFVLWGFSDHFAQPNETLGQQDYGFTTWIDNSHLLLSDGALLIKQVATYTLGGGDNSMTQWFSDPDANVHSLGASAITRAGDKLAFIADYGSGLENQIRIYTSNGAPPAVPTDRCNMTPAGAGPFFTQLSFSPDGQSLVYDAGDGIHVNALAGLPSCTGITDKLIIPGGARPYWGPADVGPSDRCGSCTATGSGGSGSGGSGSGGSGGGSGTGSGGSGSGGSGSGSGLSSAFSITHTRVSPGGTVVLTLSARAGGTFTARASAPGRRRRTTIAYGGGSSRLVSAGSVRLTIKPSASAARWLTERRKLRLTITIAFSATGGSSRVSVISVTVHAAHKHGGKRR